MPVSINAACKMRVGLVAAISMLVLPGPVLATGLLGTATGFAVLGASTVTNTGASFVTGDLGVSPGISLTGIGTVILLGSLHAADAVAAQAQADAVNAAASLSAMTPTTDLSGQDLGTVGTLLPGVYRFGSSAQLTGTLTLDFTGDPSRAFVFQIGTALTTAAASNVVVLGGSSASAIYWNVGSSATLGTGSTFAGNILANIAVTANSAARILCGRAIALNAAVTLNSNAISNDCSRSNYASGRSDFGSAGFSGVDSAAVPEPQSWALMIAGFGLTGAAMRRRTNRSFAVSRSARR